MKLTAKQKLHVEQAGKHLSFGYMLMTLAMDHFDDCELQLKDVGVMKQKIKQCAGRTESAYRIFCDEFKPLLGETNGGVLLKEYEELKEKINKLAFA